MQAVISNPNHKAYNLLAAVVVLAFAAFKIPDLTLPYFWDELGVYSRAALYLSEHGLSLLPGSIPPELSRGHPLLFQFLSATAFTVFGKSVVVGHGFALVVTLLLLIAVYRQLSVIGNKLAGFCAMLLLATQPVFIAQSTMLLPEMMLALFVFLSLTAYYRRRFVLFALHASLALLVKESAIVIPFVALAYGFWEDVISSKHKGYVTGKTVGLTFVPQLIFAAFLLVQKAQNGWFFFPEHIGHVSFDVERLFVNNHGYQKFLFFEQGRYWWVKIFVVGVVCWVLRKKLNPTGFTWLSVILVVAFVAFSCLNFYMNRYMLPVFPFIVFLVAVSLYAICPKAVWMVPVTALLSVLCLRDINSGYFNYDCDMGYRHHLQVQQQLLNKLCEIDDGTTTIKADFPMYFATSEPEYKGFKGCGISPTRLQPYGKIHLMITGMGVFPAEGENRKLIFQVKENYAEGRIYEEK